MSDLLDALRTLATAGKLLGPKLPGVAGAVIESVGAGAALAADLVAAGHNPVAQIERLRRHDTLLADVRRDWEQRFRDKFGEEIYEPDSSPTQVSPREEED
jgi:hypothetical protein